MTDLESDQYIHFFVYIPTQVWAGMGLSNTLQFICFARQSDDYGTTTVIPIRQFQVKQKNLQIFLNELSYYSCKEESHIYSKRVKILQTLHPFISKDIKESFETNISQKHWILYPRTLNSTTGIAILMTPVQRLICDAEIQFFCKLFNIQLFQKKLSIFCLVTLSRQINALSFYKSQNVLFWSKFFGPDQKLNRNLCHSKIFCDGTKTVFTVWKS